LSWRSIHDDVDPQNLHGIQRVWNSHKCGKGNERQCCNTGAELEPYKVTDVIENAFSFFNCRAGNNRELLVFTTSEKKEIQSSNGKPLS
jgi:hypothetical protein